MTVWYDDMEAEKPHQTEGMCPNRPGSGPDKAYSVNQPYVVNMQSYIQGKFEVNDKNGCCIVRQCTTQINIFYSMFFLKWKLNLVCCLILWTFLYFKGVDRIIHIADRSFKHRQAQFDRRVI